MHPLSKELPYSHLGVKPRGSLHMHVGEPGEAHGRNMQTPYRKYCCGPIVLFTKPRCLSGRRHSGALEMKFGPLSKLSLSDRTKYHLCCDSS